MGVMAASGITGEGGSLPEPKEVPETPEAPAPEQKTDFVPFARVEDASKPATRRGRGTLNEQAQQFVEERLNTRLQEFESKFSQERQGYDQRLQEAANYTRQQAETIARLQGQIEAIQARPATPATPAAPAADPDRLLEEAEEALTKNDLRTYHRKMTEAATARARGEVGAELKTLRADIEKRIPQPMDPFIASQMAANRNVAMAGPQGAEWVRIKDGELALRGMRPGPERMAKAFELADKEIEATRKPQRPAGFDQQAASALASVPTARPAGNGGKASPLDGYQPTELEKQVARDAGMTMEQYVKYKFPQKFLKR